MKHTKTKKTKKGAHHPPIHLHFEYFFRKQYCLLLVIGLLALAIAKSDGKMFGIMRDAYAEGYGVIGAYMREETSRTPLTLEVSRIATISGQ